ncbi:helix-turn-helix domain-containing protein [Granulosicoccaceae sp. 1_MG-2023]|nr:helix-turn-helix domain-containing protein [Granulosicoccaceae sp. 1_MG-2023]
MSQHASPVNSLTGIRSKQPWLVMRSADKFSLRQSPNPDISHFYVFEAGQATETTFGIPDGCIDIMFDCDPDHPKAEVFGTPLSASVVDLHSGHRYFGVRFKAGVIPDCMKASAAEMVASHYHFQDLFSNADQAFEEIVSSKRFARQVALLEAFLAPKKRREFSPLTSIVAQRIAASQGRIRICELEESTGYTSRTIERQFRADVGMSPKAFCRIIRCQSSVYAIHHNDDVCFSGLATDLGFSDQSHFLREFKKQVSTTPKNYLKRVKDKSYLDRLDHICPTNAH